MTDLLTRMASATEGQERELLIDAFDKLFPPGRCDFKKYLAFEQMVNAHAWTSAAEMLLPEGWSCVLSWLDRNKMAGAVLFHAKLTECRAEAPFPWAALASACVKARGL